MFVLGYVHIGAECTMTMTDDSSDVCPEHVYGVEDLENILWECCSIMVHMQDNGCLSST